MQYFRPEYIFRPTQILRRIAYAAGLTREIESARTPWGLPISFDPRELHGRAMLTLGLSDLRTNEVISRLLRPGDIAIDIGANIGIMTSLMAVRAGPTGSVYAFEPHPNTRQKLQVNVESWQQSRYPTATVTVFPYAASVKSGKAALIEPDQFAANSGVATLGKLFNDEDQRSCVKVETISFDDWSSGLGQVRLVKIDVEGHEDSVLYGMEKSLGLHNIDCLVFEEMRPLPSPATKYLEQHGYTCHMIDRSFFGPSLIDVHDRPRKLRGEATNILATRQPDDAAMLSGGGWSCLR